MHAKARRIWAVVIRHIFTLPRDLEGLSEVFWWPTFDVLIWGFMTIFLQKNQGLPSMFISIFIGAIVLWMFVYRAQQEMAVLFLREVWDRNLLNMLASPLTIWEFLFGSLILGIIKISVSAIWMNILAFVFFTFNIFTFGNLLVPYIISLLIVGWSAGFIITGLVVQYGYRMQALAWMLVAVIQPFSAVFYSVSSMPLWMQYIAKALPTSYIFEGMRQVLRSGKFDLNGLVIASGLNVLYLVLAMLFFKRSFRKAQESGMIVKFN